MYNGLEAKQEMEAQLLRLLKPLKPCYSESGALLQLGNTSAHYPERVAQLEGFARVLWGLAPYWKGGGSQDELLGVYRRGLSAGTNPAGPEYWDAQGEVNQRYVEMAAISLGLLLVPQLLWEPLEAEEKGRLASWLYKINLINPSEYPDCNWWFFVVLTNLALKQLGQSYDPLLAEAALARIEAFYLGDGWYQDGTSGRKDYYVSFAIHYYSLLYAVFAQKDDPERCQQFRRRADRFALDFIYWFDDRGRAVPYGRSLIYRFAQGAFWAAYAFAGGQALPMGVVKGMLLRHLRQWMNSPIFDRDGVLTIGYRYPCLNMAETYNAPGSPYWALKIFLVLALPESHPFWQEEEQAMPPREAAKHFNRGQMLVQVSPGHTVMYPSAIFRNDSFGHMPEKYGKFAYSTEFGFSVATGDGDLELAAPDSMLAFSLDGYYFVRRSAGHTVIEDGRVCSSWSPVRGIQVKTILTLTPLGHIRRHTVTNMLAACVAYDCGFAVPAPSPVGYSFSAEGGRAFVGSGGASCQAVLLQGSGVPQVIVAAPNTNVCWGKTAIPCIRYSIPEGTSVLETEIIAEVR